MSQSPCFDRRIPVLLARHLIIGRSPDSRSLMPLLRQSRASRFLVVDKSIADDGWPELK